jgi:hypothetical protein
LYPADAPFPSGASEHEWRFARSRDGYSLFRIGLALSEIPKNGGASPRRAEAISPRDASRGGEVQKIPFTVREPFPPRFDSNLRCYMTQAQHYKSQADQAKRLARQVTNSEVREKLLEMAGEYSRYAELMEARERPFERALG